MALVDVRLVLGSLDEQLVDGLVDSPGALASAGRIHIIGADSHPEFGALRCLNQHQHHLLLFEQRLLLSFLPVLS